MRYAGIKNGKISILSEQTIKNKDLEVVQIPSELEHLSNNDLITTCRLINGKIVSKLAKMKAKDMKVALVANYGSKCGIGTYSRFLFEELTKLIGDYRIFSEETEYLDTDARSIPSNKILPCWKRGESLQKLTNAIKNYNPDVVIIQHEFGLFPSGRYFISMMNQLSSHRVINVMHSIFKHTDKAIFEACMPEIIVHLEGAKSVLLEKGINGKINVIPHGCFPCIDTKKLWNSYRTKNTFVQFGFLFKYKFFQTSIEAAAILKEKYPDVYFTGICSESPYAQVEHQLYYEELMCLIEKLGLQENVGLIRGFQSEKVIDYFLRVNKVAVFPYQSDPQHECWGSSGSAVVAATKAIPIITSNAHHFENLPVLKGDSAQEIANHLDCLFSNEKLVKTQIERQNQYLIDNSWKITAKRYVEVLES